MNTESLLIDWIKDEEGFREEAYLDCLGVPTFGYGFTTITKAEAELILHNRINSIKYDIIRFLAKNDIELDEFRKVVIMDMCYQLGLPRLAQFTRMLDALKRMDYDSAANEMIDSKWHSQTPSRCELLAKRMRRGC